MRLSTRVPALPVQNIEAAVAFYASRLGFVSIYQEDGFAKLLRDDAEVHLWAADDRRWQQRPDMAEDPVRSGAESFIAGTASCRIQVDEVDELYAELSAADVLHPGDNGSAEDTAWGTREFAVLDLVGNLLTFFARRPSRLNE